MGLRNYQIESLNAVRDARQRNVRHALLVYPTGGGKTLAISHLPEYMGMQAGEQMLVLVHRDELVHQTVDKLQKYNPHLTATIEKAELTADIGADLIVASVQTIGRNPLKEGKYEFSERIKKFDPNRVKYVCVDEAHHALGHSYKSVLAYFGCLKGTKYDREEKFLLGVTATPNRGDNAGLEGVFDEIVYSKPLLEMIGEGWLTDLKAYRVDTTVDLSSVKTSLGDFAVKELEKTVNTPSRNKLIVDKYVELGEDQRAIAFTVDVQHSEDLAKAFNESGVRAYAISGSMPMNDRRKVLQLFRSGFYRVLTSCGVLNEGFDDPGVCVGLMARPTKSGLLYRQQCLDDQTEILTPDGWKRREEICAGSTVASYDIVSGEIQWCLAEDKVERPLGDEDMYSISSPHVDIRVTAGHRMIYRSASLTAKNRKIIDAASLAQKKQHYRIPVSGLQYAQGVPLSDDELRFVGWVLTDGTINPKNNQITIAQSEQKKQNLDAIESCLQGCGLKYGQYRHNRAGDYAHHPASIEFTVSKGAPRGRDKHLSGWGHLEAYLDKSLSPQMESLTSRQLGVLLEAMNLGDGAKCSVPWTRRTYSITCGTNRVLAERLQSLCVRRGFRCNMSIQAPRGVDWFYLYIRPDFTDALVGGASGEVGRSRLTKCGMSRPDEVVWCVTTRLGTIVTRRNGKVAIVGNCGRVLRPFPAPEEIKAMRAEGKEPSWIKPHAIVIDFCDVSGRHTLHTAPTLFGMNAKASLKGNKAGETASEMEKIIRQKNLPLEMEQVESLEKLKAIAERIDLLKPPAVPSHVRAMSQFSWVEYAKDCYSLCLPDRKNGTMKIPQGIIRVSQNMLGQWEVSKSLNGIKTVLGQSRELNDAIRRADQEVPPEARVLMNGQSGWRNKPVTEAQISYMWRLDHKGRRQFGDMATYTMAVRKQYPTSGIASDRINQLKGV